MPTPTPTPARVTTIFLFILQKKSKDEEKKDSEEHPPLPYVILSERVLPIYPMYVVISCSSFSVFRLICPLIPSRSFSFSPLRCFFSPRHVSDEMGHITQPPRKVFPQALSFPIVPFVVAVLKNCMCLQHASTCSLHTTRPPFTLAPRVSFPDRSPWRITQNICHHGIGRI